MRAENQVSPSLANRFRGKSLLSPADFQQRELGELLDLALGQKQGRLNPGTPLRGKSVALVFFDPSLRTRTSMVIAIQQLGGVPVVLDVGKEAWALEYLEGVVMDQDKSEHIKEAAPVLSQYVDAIGVRCFPKMQDYGEDRKEMVLKSFQRYASVPTLNLESSTQHPFQALGDALTIQEKFGTLKRRRVVLAWTKHPKPLPMSVANSFALVAALFGMDLTIASPPEYQLDPEIIVQLNELGRSSGATVQVCEDLEEACESKEIVYAKSWGSLKYYGRPDQEKKRKSRYRDWTITERLMERTAQGSFMHCLPVRRNVVVEDAVLDGPRSIVVEQSANRLHIQKTLLSLILSDPVSS